MFTIELVTDKPHVRLIAPDVARDAPLGVAWLDGYQGRETLRLMGVPDADNKPSSLAAEQARIRDFLERTDQLNWMIEVDGKVVGAVWANLKATAELPAPSVHIMIGDAAARGRGAGTAALEAVVNYLAGQKGLPTVYSRYLTGNAGSAALLRSLHFDTLGPAYVDNHELQWQNAVYHR